MLAAIVASAIFIIPIIFILALFLDHYDKYRWNWLIFLATVGLFMYSYDIPLAYMGGVGLGSIIIGIIYCFFYKYKSYIKSVVERARKGDISKETANEMIGWDNNKMRIATWVIAWPVSLFSDIIGDLLDIFANLWIGLWRTLTKLKNLLLAKTIREAKEEIDKIDDNIYHSKSKW